MQIEEYIDAIRSHGDAMADATDLADPDTNIPTCPGWVMRDLIRHTGEVHRWATGIIGEARSEPWNASPDEIVGEWPGDDELASWFRSGVAALVRALSDAPADLACWTFMPSPTPLTFWARRQAHEIAIHHADARIPSGDSPEYGVDLAVDGIDELLVASLPRRGRGPRSDPAVRIGVETTDSGDRWLATIGAERFMAERGDSHPAECTIRGTAGEVYLFLWNRVDRRALTVEGDKSVLDLWRAGASI